MAKKVTKVPGLKTQGAKKPAWNKLGNEDSESAKMAPAEQMKGTEAKKLKKEKE